MNQVLGHSVGNAVEVQESIDCLMNPAEADTRLVEITLQLAAHMLFVGGLEDDLNSAYGKAQKALESGDAAQIFARMCSRMGAEQSILDSNLDLFPSLPINQPIVASTSGYVTSMDTHAIGMAMVSVGAGRRVASDKVDHGLGLTRVVAIGDYVEAGAPIALAHMRTQQQFQVVDTALQQGLVLSQQQPTISPLIYQTITTDGVAL